MKLTNVKKFNIYVFLSTFARNLIELFIPMILYKNGYNLKEVMLILLTMVKDLKVMIYITLAFIATGTFFNITNKGKREGIIKIN